MQFRLHKLFVPRFEEQLANIHDWIERMEVKEMQLLQVPISLANALKVVSVMIFAQRMGFRDKKWTIPGGNYGDWALVLDARYM